MWLFMSRWFRRYALVALALPIVGWFLERLGVGVERRYGRNAPARVLRGGGDWLSGQSSGPLARRIQRRRQRMADRG